MEARANSRGRVVYPQERANRDGPRIKRKQSSWGKSRNVPDGTRNQARVLPAPVFVARITHTRHKTTRHTTGTLTLCHVLPSPSSFSHRQDSNGPRSHFLTIVARVSTGLEVDLQWPVRRPSKLFAGILHLWPSLSIKTCATVEEGRHQYRSAQTRETQRS